MLKYICKRLIYLVLTLWVIVTATFFLMKSFPALLFDAERFNMMSAQQQHVILEQYGLNESLPKQYIKYMGNILHGDFGNFFYLYGTKGFHCNRRKNWSVGIDRNSGSIDRSGTGACAGNYCGVETQQRN